MAEETVVNGGGDVNVEITTSEQDLEDTANQTIQKLMQKISVLEQEKHSLVNDNQSSAVKIKQLEDEIQSSESDKRALSSIAARASDLETEVSRLQHDLISSMSDSQESNNEVVELKQVIEKLKLSESENLEKIDVIEKERNLLLERLNEHAEKYKETESRCREFEKKIEGIEMEVKDLKSLSLKYEEEGKNKDEQIRNLNKNVESFQSVIAKNRGEMEKVSKEKEELEIVKNDLEALLKKSERKVDEMEDKLEQVRNELEAFEKINHGLKETLAEDTNGIAGDGDEKKVKGLKKIDWPIVAATTGAVAMVAVVYFRHAKF
ncbi:peroxisomal and mitochondrial division factor 2-like [Rutidosis leptorrhynchoides]|uniref:peroxisomal and mitochondrial division factor 2-like n=1 Tax=Rutidosis leptorrhynchoides TaxID=125765 RepID=UPI003A98EED9